MSFIREQKYLRDQPAQYKEQKKLPFTITYDVEKGAASRYNALVETASIAKRVQARERAVAAISQVWENSNAIRAGKAELPKIKVYQESIKSWYSRIATKLYNYFLNITFN